MAASMSISASDAGGGVVSYSWSCSDTRVSFSYQSGNLFVNGSGFPIAQSGSGSVFVGYNSVANISGNCTFFNSAAQLESASAGAQGQTGPPPYVPPPTYYVKDSNGAGWVQSVISHQLLVSNGTTWVNP